MDLTARHHWAEYAQILSSYCSASKTQADIDYKPQNIKYSEQRFLISNLMSSYDDAHKMIFLCMAHIIGITLFIILAETEIIDVIKPHGEGTLIARYGFFTYICPPILCIYLGIAYFLGEMRYLTIEGDQAIIHTKKRGKWPVPIKDLHFHIIKGGLIWKQYYLELEIPETTFTDYDRMFIIEVAARKETIDGMLAVLLPLFQGDTTLYNHAKDRKYIKIPKNEKPGLWGRYNNLTSHLHIWLTIYKYNQLLFWLLHKKWDKIFD